MIPRCACCPSLALPGDELCRACLVSAGEPAPEPPRPYYQRGPITLYHGKAEEVLPYLHERGHVICDPPYSKHVHGKSRAGARALTTGAGHDCISREVDFGFAYLSAELRWAMVRETKRLTERWALFFSDVESAWLWRLSLVAMGMDYVRTCSWHKLASTPQFTGDRPAVAEEAITTVHQPGRKRWNGGGKQGFYEHAVTSGRGIFEDREHTTQKPEKLMIELIDDFTDPGDLVYDYCAGYGTTGIGCIHGAGGPRRFVGVEMSEKYCQKAAERFDLELDVTTKRARDLGQLPLLGGIQ